MKILFGIFLFTSFISLAQLTEPIMGQSYSTERRENFNGFLGENNTTLFSVDYLYVSRKKQELIIRKFYKKDLKQVDAVNIYQVPEDGFYGEPVEVFYMNDSLFLFSNLFDEKQKKMFINYEIFDIHGTLLFQTIVDTLPDNEDLKIIQDKSKMGFALVRSNKFSQLTEQEVDVKFINNFGDVLHVKKLKSPMALQNINIEEIVYASDDRIYILCNYNFSPASVAVEDNREMINNKYALWIYDRPSGFLQELELRMKGKWINGIKIIPTISNQLLVSGFFNETKYHSINGTFSLLIGKNLELKESSFYKFSDEILHKFIDEKDRGKIKELSDYKLIDLAMLENGSYFLLGERYYKYIERNYDPRTNITTTTEHFNYNSIVISYHDSIGNHIWTDRIPKFQSSTNDFGYYSSFAFLNTGNDLYFFFNDSEKNNEIAVNDYFNYKGLYNNRRFQISAVHVDTAGIVSRKALIGPENSFMLRAKESNCIGKNTMYLLAEVGKDAKVFSVSVKK